MGRTTVNSANRIGRLTTISVAATALTVALGGLSAARADTVSFSNIVASWVNGTPSSNVTYVNNNSSNPQAYWGGQTPLSNDSGYTFQSPASQPVTATVPPSPSSDFILGTFQHINEPIPSGTSITGIDLYVTTDVHINATDEGNLTFKFHFDHDETPNGDNPCANGQPNNQGVNINGCADHVQVSALSGTGAFTIGANTYTVNIVGFEQGGVQTSSFWTEEDAINTADLVANVDLYTNVVGTPEPSTWTMMLAGFIGLGALARRKITRIRLAS
jgi:hypothetical protein